MPRVTRSQRTSANASSSARVQALMSTSDNRAKLNWDVGSKWRLAGDIDTDTDDDYEDILEALTSLNLENNASFDQFNQALKQKIIRGRKKIRTCRARSDMYIAQSKFLREAQAYESGLSPVDGNRHYERQFLNAQIRLKAQEFACRRLLNEKLQLEKLIEEWEKGL